MPYFEFFWTPYREQKLADHGLTREEVEFVISHPDSVESSRSSGLPLAKGYTEDGRWIICVYRMLNDLVVEPITAFEPYRE
jgi:uncharacterized DUF497 family protein